MGAGDGRSGGKPLAASFHAGDIDLALTVGSGLAALLAQLHRHEIAHNDINPESILFDGRSKSVRLIDFALASAGIGADLPRQKLPSALAYCAPSRPDA